MHIPEPIPDRHPRRDLRGRDLPHPRPARPRAPDRALARAGHVRASRADLEGAGRHDRDAQAAPAGSSARSRVSTSSSPARSGRGGSRSRATARANASRCISRRARRCTSASTTSSPPPTRSSTPTSGSRASGACCSAEPGSSSTTSRRTRATRSCGCTATGTSSSSTSTHGEQIDVEPGAWLYKDPTVTMEAVTMGLKSGIMGGGGKLTWNRFTGPGRLAIQTMFLAPDRVGGVPGATSAAEGGLVGSVLGGLMRS